MKYSLALIFAITTIYAQDCSVTGGCNPYEIPVVATLVEHDCYPADYCNAPNCPGLKCTDLYALYFQDGPDTPCGYLTCGYCAQCAGGNCLSGTHVALNKRENLTPVVYSLHTHIHFAANVKIPNARVQMKTITLPTSRFYWRRA